MRFLLLQVRNPDDPMRRHEVRAFARALSCDVEHIFVLDLLNEPVNCDVVRPFDAVLLGGSGDYSATGSQPWLLRALDGLKRLRDGRIPVFASCWGFQAFARALGGVVERDEDRAEVGTYPVWLTEASKSDPVFGGLPDRFNAHMGHMDHVTQLPPGAILLASSELSQNQAYTFPDWPIYATQFHPELRKDDLLCRLQQYPEYVKGVAGMSRDDFVRQLHDTPECNSLLLRFVGSLRKLRPNADPTVE